MFGAKTPFGASSFGTGTSTFGTQATASPFGQTAASNTSGGLFGNTQSGFGTFGATQQSGSGLFGGNAASTSNTGLFGAGGTTTGSLFGQPAASTAGSVFGSNANTTGTNLFGSGGFGTTGTSNLFGSQATSKASTGLFGAASTGTQSSLFNANSGFQSSGFGAGTQTAQGTPVKFAVVSGSDQMVKNGITQTVNTRHQSITVMKEYESKSFEELRFEDYNLNRKSGPTGGTTTVTTSANTGSLFGGYGGSFSAFSQPKTGGFGTTSSSLFGQTAQQPASGGLFSSKPVTGGLFGTSTAPTSTTGFGSTFGSTTPASGGLFAQTSNTQTGGLFGTTPSTQSGSLFGGTTAPFGQTNTAGTGLFGQSTFGNTQSTGLFNKPATGTTFGASTSGGLFGTANKPATSTFGGFGAGFGTAAAGSNTLFGKPAFGTTNTLGSTFGSSAAGSNLFGGTNTGLNTGVTALGTGLGGNTGFGQTGTGLNLGTNTLLGAQNANLGVAQQQQQQLLLNQQILALNNSPFGDSKLFRNSLTDKPSSKAATSTTASSQSVLGSPSHYKVSSKLTAKIKPRPINHHTMNKSKLFEGLDDDVGLSPDTFVPRKSIKKLVIKKQTTEDQDSPSTPETQPCVQTAAAYPTVVTPSLNDSDHTSSPMGVRFSTGTRKSTVDSNPNSTADNKAADLEIHNGAHERRLERCGVILTRPEYYTIPAIEELNEMIDSNGEVWVNDFIVGRQGYGQVKFLGKTDVADLNLDEIVFFRRREIEVYPEGYPNKPPVGQGLNKKAEITLIKVWPNDKTTHQPIKSPERLRLQHWMEKVEAATAKLDAVFMDYRPETGTWVFVVEHFTKYGIHEFLDAEQLAKKPMTTLDHISKKEFQKTDLTNEEEKMLIAKKIQEQQEKLEAFEREKEKEKEIEKEIEKEKVSSESMQDQDSDIDELDHGTFPDDPIDEDPYDELPASHQLASALGVSAHRMQVMKASFFGESVQQPLSPSNQTRNVDTRKSTFQHAPLISHGDGRDLALFASPKRVSDVLGKTALMPHTMAASSPSSRIMNPSAIGSALDRGTKLIGARAHQRQLVPKDKSITNSKEDCVADLGLVMGRSFRVGWGPGFVFTHSGQPKGQKSDKTSSVVISSVTQDVLMSKSRLLQEAIEGLSPFGVVKERVNIADHLTRDNQSALMQHVIGLEVQLEHSKISTHHGCPLFEPIPGTEGLHHHADVCNKNLKSLVSGPLHETEKHMNLVWNLVVALWGQLDQIDSDSYNTHMARRHALCTWLLNACKEKVQAEVEEQDGFEESDYLKAIWSHLSGGQINQACNLAKKHKDHRLSMLLSQATGHITGRQLLQKQLRDWGEVLKVDEYITDQRLKIFALLAGSLVWQTSTTRINTCEGLDWKRTLAVHMLYQNSPTASISNIVSCYDDAFEGNTSHGCYGAAPYPPYMEDSVDQVDTVQDMCYHLLKLYCDRSYQLENALDPSTYTLHQLDYRQSWHLSMALVSLGYSHLPEYNTCLLHTSFAAQLEAIGLWQWAAFVLLHISDCTGREHAVRSLLYRYCELSKSAEYLNKEKFLSEKLHIPAEWIHEAKALQAIYDNIPEQEAVHLLKSNQWNRCHEVVLHELTSEAIINEEFDDLFTMLSALEPPERSSTIKNWASGGQVILDCLKIDRKVKQITEGLFEKYDFEDLHIQLSSLCHKINHLPSTTAKQRLCQYELAQRCANYLKLVTSELNETGEDTPLQTGAIVPHISQLPLPEDCTLAELRDLTAQYLAEI